jgi:thiamine pyrophosphate-dependent acetolactate synthase large subunit-like protein
MQDLFKQYLDRDISRSALLRGLTAAGLTASAASAFADGLRPEAASAQAAPTPQRTIRDTGGTLFVQQLKAAGVRYYFFNPSTGDAPIFDAISNEPSIQLIKGIQEGVVVGMADGYARLSGKIGVCSIANVGLPNGMTQLVNAYKDRTSLLIVIASFGANVSGKDGPQDYEHQVEMMQPLTKWYWETASAGTIPEVTRRALKFATTPPTGPVFLAFPDDQLATVTSATIMDAPAYDVAMHIRPDAADVQRVAKLLIEAKNPILTVGDEITTCNAGPEVTELAELLGLPVAGGGEFGVWSKPFPNQNPLYLGPTLKNMRFPGNTDVRVNIGSQYGEISLPGQVLVSMRLDPTSLGRNAPIDVPLVANVKYGTADLIAAVKSMATSTRLRQIADDRSQRVHAYTAGLRQMREAMIKEFPSGEQPGITLERLAFELENGLDRDTIYVNDIDSGKKMDPYLSFGGSDKMYVGNGPNILGWGMSAAAGAKLAQPNRQVVGVLGDGAFLFGGPQPLWSQARYSIPVTNIVLNNKSYNNERNRIWSFGAAQQFASGRDMTCYNGSPDVDFAKTSQAFGVEAENVSDPTQIKAALARAKRANVGGRPYLIAVDIQRDGVGAESAWYPPFNLAATRTHNV